MEYKGVSVQWESAGWYCVFSTGNHVIELGYISTVEDLKEAIDNIKVSEFYDWSTERHNDDDNLDSLTDEDWEKIAPF